MTIEELYNYLTKNKFVDHRTNSTWRFVETNKTDYSGTLYISEPVGNFKLKQSKDDLGLTIFDLSLTREVSQLVCGSDETIISVNDLGGVIIKGNRGFTLARESSI